MTEGFSQHGADLVDRQRSLSEDYLVDAVTSLKDRELATIAALAAMGSKGSRQIASHMHSALDAGATRQEIAEGLATLSQACGTPLAVNGLATAYKVFKERDEDGRATEAEKLWDYGDAPGGTVQERWDRALLTIEKVYPAGPTDETYSNVAELAPHFWRDMVGVFYNDLFNHPGADIKYRELFVMCAYAAVNSTPLQIIWHTNGALNTGWSRQEVIEIFTHLSLHIGLPNATTAIRYVAQVFADRDARGTTKSHEFEVHEVEAPVVDARFERGLAVLGRLNPENLSQGAEWNAVTSLSPTLQHLSVGYLYGDLFDRSGLDEKSKAIAIVSALVAMGIDAEQLSFHIEFALNAGVSRDQIRDAISLMSAIGGFGKAVDAAASAKIVFDRRDTCGLKN